MVPSPRPTRMLMQLSSRLLQFAENGWRKGTVIYSIHSPRLRLNKQLSESPCVIPMENTRNSRMCQDQGIATQCLNSSKSFKIDNWQPCNTGKLGLHMFYLGTIAYLLRITCIHNEILQSILCITSRAMRKRSKVKSWKRRIWQNWSVRGIAGWDKHFKVSKRITQAVLKEKVLAWKSLTPLEAMKTGTGHEWSWYKWPVRLVIA